MRSDPKAIMMTLRSWLDLVQVQEVVNKASDEVQKAFSAVPIVPNTMKLVTRESADVEFLANSVEASQSWPELTGDSTVHQKFLNFDHKVDAHESNLQTMSE